MSSVPEGKMDESPLVEKKERKAEEKKSEDTRAEPVFHYCGSGAWNPHTIKCDLDIPCPTSSCDDISQDYEVNNWVLNHLPLKSYEQKEEFAKLLLADQRKQEIKEQSAKKAETTKVAEKKKKGRGKKKPRQKRKPVKGLPTFS
jgi:hypothetical protein